VNRKKAVVLILLLLIAGGGTYFAFVHSTGPSGKTVQASPPEAPRPAVPDPVSEGPRDAPEGKLRLDFMYLHQAVLQYFARHDEVPLGPSHEEMVRQMSQVVPSLKLRAATVTNDGRLLDPWGTQVFFHVPSSKRMDMRSAGPDKQFETYDDIILLGTGNFISERDLRRMESPDGRYLGFTGRSQ
jgi:hypothetical protein